MTGSERSAIGSWRRTVSTDCSELSSSEGSNCLAISESLRKDDDSSAVCARTPEDEYCRGSSVPWPPAWWM